MSWFAKLRDALGRSRESMEKIETLATARRPLDRDFWDELEEALIALTSADNDPVTERVS